MRVLVICSREQSERSTVNQKERWRDNDKKNRCDRFDKLEIKNSEIQVKFAFCQRVAKNIAELQKKKRGGDLENLGDRVLRIKSR